VHVRSVLRSVLRCRSNLDLERDFSVCPESGAARKALCFEPLCYESTNSLYTTLVSGDYFYALGGHSQATGGHVQALGGIEILKITYY